MSELTQAQQDVIEEMKQNIETVKRFFKETNKEQEKEKCATPLLKFFCNTSDGHYVQTGATVNDVRIYLTEAGTTSSVFLSKGDARRFAETVLRTANSIKKESR